MSKTALFLFLSCGPMFFSQACAEPPVLVELDRGEVRLGDVVEIEPVHEKAFEPLTRLTLFQLPTSQSIELSADDLENIIIDRAPALEGHLKLLDRRPRQFARRHDLDQQVDISQFLCLVDDVPAGQAILRQHTVLKDACRDMVEPATKYDPATGTYIASRDIAAGTALPLANRSILPVAIAGEELRLVSQVGSVRVSRSVSLVTPVFETGRIFVRTAQGEIIETYFLEEGHEGP